MNVTNRQIIQGPGGSDFAVLGGQELPHSLEAEERLLACVMADETGAGWAVALNGGVKAKAFFNPRHQQVWELITELRQGGQSGIDIALLAEEFRLRGQLDQLGGYAFLAQISKAQPTSLSVRYYAEIVVLLWEMRHAVKLAQEVREAAMVFESREAFAAKASYVGQKLIGLGRKSSTLTMAEEIGEAREHIMSIAEGRFDRSRLVCTDRRW
jgi:replicative DNA helicase